MKFQASKAIGIVFVAAILWGIAVPGVLRAQGQPQNPPEISLRTAMPGAVRAPDESPKEPKIFVKLYPDRLIVTSEDEPVATIPISRIRALSLETRTRYPVKAFISEAVEAAGDWDDLLERAGPLAPVAAVHVAAEAVVAWPFRWVRQSRHSVQVVWEDAQGELRLTMFRLRGKDAKKLLGELSRITELNWFNLDERDLRHQPSEGVTLRLRRWVWIGDTRLGPGDYSASFCPFGSDAGALVVYAGGPGIRPLAAVPVSVAATPSESGFAASVKPDILGQLHLTELRIGSADLRLFPSAAVPFTPASRRSKPAYARATEASAETSRASAGGPERR